MPTRGALQAYSVFDFARGLDLKTSPLKLALLKGQNALTRADNAIYTASGAASKRLDAPQLTTVALGGSNTIGHLITNGLGNWTPGADVQFLPTLGFLGTGTATTVITGGREFVKSDGTRITVVGTNDGRLFTVTTAGFGTEIASGLTAGTKWYFEQYHDKLICANRADPPRTYDGTTVALLGGSPPAKAGPVAVHGNRVFFLDGDNKSRVTWSALDDEEDYTTPSNAGNADISPNDGSDLLDLVPSINELVLLKGRRPYRLQGTSPSTFTIANVVPTTGSVGAVSTQAAVFAVNQVWYAAPSGVVSLIGVQQFGDLRESFASDKIRPYWEPDSDVVLSLNRLEDAVMAYDAQWNRLYLAADTDNDGANDTLLVYDLSTKGWSVWDGIGVASLWPVRNPDTGISEMWAGGYDGTIRVLNRGGTSAAIACRITHLSCLDTPGVEKSVRHLFLYLKEQGNYTVTVTTRMDFGAAGGQPAEVSLLGAAHTLGVNWVLGVDPLGRREQIVKRLDTHATGEFLEVEVANLNAGEPFTWYGYEVLSRPRRVVRRGTAAVS